MKETYCCCCPRLRCFRTFTPFIASQCTHYSDSSSSGFQHRITVAPQPSAVPLDWVSRRRGKDSSFHILGWMRFGDELNPLVRWIGWWKILKTNLSLTHLLISSFRVTRLSGNTTLVVSVSRHHDISLHSPNHTPAAKKIIWLVGLRNIFWAHFWERNLENGKWIGADVPAQGNPIWSY